MPDHGVLFSQLQETVRREISPHSVLLKSKDCNTGITYNLIPRLLVSYQTQMFVVICRNEGNHEGDTQAANA